MFLLDTNILSEFYRKNANVRQHIIRHQDNTLHTSSVVMAEIYFGIENCLRYEDKLNLISFYSPLEKDLKIINFDLKSAKIYARLKRTLRQKGRPVEDFDLIIAATCLAYGLTLVTKNGRHFADIEELQTEDWTIEPVKT